MAISGHLVGCCIVVLRISLDEVELRPKIFQFHSLVIEFHLMFFRQLVHDRKRIRNQVDATVEKNRLRAAERFFQLMNRVLVLEFVLEKTIKDQSEVARKEVAFDVIACPDVHRPAFQIALCHLERFFDFR